MAYPACRFTAAANRGSDGRLEPRREALRWPDSEGAGMMSMSHANVSSWRV